MAIRCSICSTTVASWHLYTIHMRTVHALHWSGSTVLCGQGGCPRRFSSFNSLRNHIFKQHATVLEVEESLNCESAYETRHVHTVDCPDIDDSSAGLNDPEMSVDTDIHFEALVNDFVCQLQAKSSTNVKLVDEVLVMVKTLLNSIVEPICELTDDSACDVS